MNQTHLMLMNCSTLLGGFAGKRPKHLGIKEGQLAPCPNKPNCVSSFSDRSKHAIEPLHFQGAADMALATLKQVVAAMDGATLIEAQINYLYFEFKTKVLGFVDDVEFLLDEGKKIIHLRSASRLGHSDFNLNRKRIEAIRANFKA